MHGGAAGRLPSLRELPLPWRALIACALIFILGGYFAALVNLVGQNELVDGEPGMSAADLQLKYHGGWVEVRAGSAAPSRMLEMIQGAMREYFHSDEEFDVLLNWLESGAGAEAFQSGTEPTPADVILATCLKCHAADSGKEIGTRSPFGPDSFNPALEMISKFTLAVEPGQERVWRNPRDWRDLALTTHAHMLSVPILTVALGALFLWTGWLEGRRALRTTLACAPLVLFLADIAFWWLARLPGVGAGFALGIGVTGALFGLCFLLQWITIMTALWTKRSGAPQSSRR